MYKKILMVLALVCVLTANDSYNMNFDRETTCTVRNFKVYEAPQWVCKIELNSGKELFFCSPKSMLEFYLVPGRWYHVGVKSESDFKNIVVTDYETLKPINARGAFYVYGSNTISPAGDDLIPFATYDAAKKFASEHNGKRILSFTEISVGLIDWLNG
ncbi:hypothetical protein CVO_03375 [Sulfurimonas sp. CVO]|jgi:nitrous oxide reductase accessory protein NosL|uniref:Nitrous oxide reductase accessory protein NosL n=1 Tax=Sulfurimonas xiamenensis TaxID=2590021 RepID=A0AAJ4A492_9BACT|nr:MULTISPECIES: nitrous oxide reductase accessory protein NosL [Sulfurimonas]PLY16046.1 MAG: hypothetical protein C0628_01575 [Sulfurimonas sp.]QFR43498.1 hypothetical protein FJR47_06095 [Sulfurimonas xiamenensis]QHG90936.1 hypothetical protein CVO_03375 [Sulfurimonas sp. CVO]